MAIVATVASGQGCVELTPYLGGFPIGSPNDDLLLRGHRLVWFTKQLSTRWTVAGAERSSLVDYALKNLCPRFLRGDQSLGVDSEQHSEIIDGRLDDALTRVGWSIPDLQTLIWPEHQVDTESVEDALEGISHMPSGSGRKQALMVNAAMAIQAPAYFDVREVLLQMLRLTQKIENWHQLATVVLELAELRVSPFVAGFNLGVLADLLPNAGSIAKASSIPMRPAESRW